jgi:hypothetical protein
MMNVLLVIGLMLLSFDGSTSAQKLPIATNSTKCTSLAGSFCGPAWANVSLSAAYFPTIAAFDETIHRFLRGTDSQALLKAFVGCTWDPTTKVRFPHTFFCHYLAFEDSATEGCNPTPLGPGNGPILCSATCQAWLGSMNSVFNDPVACPAENATLISRRQTLIEHWGDHCRSSMVSTNGTDCVSAVDIEKSFCGFATLNAAVNFCSASSPKESCCDDPVIASELARLPGNNNKTDDACAFTDFSCIDPLKMVLLAVLIAILIIALILLWTQRNKGLKHASDTDDSYSNSRFTHPRNAKRYAVISEPVKVTDHDYSALLPEYPTLKPLKTLDRAVSRQSGASSTQDFVNRFYASEDSPNRTLSRGNIGNNNNKTLSRSVATPSRQSSKKGGLANHAFTIYSAVYDHTPGRSGELDIVTGDQIVIKEMGEDGVALAVNLNTGQEGRVPLNALETHRHTDRHASENEFL